MRNEEILTLLDEAMAALATARSALLPAPKVWAWDTTQARVAANSASLVATFAAVANRDAYCSMTIAVVNGPGWVVPAGTKPGCSDDHHLVVRDGAVDHDLWRAAISPTGTLSYAGKADVTADLASEPRPGNSNAARFPLLRGLITPEDVLKGSIDHPLVFCFPVGTATSGMGKSLYPADTDFNGPIMKYGQWFRFPPSLDVPALGLAPFETMVALAGQAHGMFCRDVGSTFSIFGVDAINQGGNASAYGSLLPLTTAGYPYARKLSGIPWAKLEALEPPQ